MPVLISHVQSHKILQQCINVTQVSQLLFTNNVVIKVRHTQENLSIT